MKLTNYEKLSLIRINKWEKRSHGSIEKKLLDGVSKPIDYIMKKIGREKFNLFEKAIEAAVNKMMNVSTYSVNSKELLKRAHENGIMIDDLSELITVNFKKLDDCNMKHIKFHGRASAAQGAVAGIAGPLAAPADLTAVLFQAFHLIQEIAFCYGYDPNDMVEKHILLRIMEVSIGSSESKFKALQEIETLTNIEKDVDQHQVSKKSVSIVSAKAVQEQIVTLSVGMITRMIPRAIPIPLITMAISAHSDHEIMEHSGEAAFMVYRKRFIERKMESSKI
jgi:hypothetical protein